MRIDDRDSMVEAGPWELLGAAEVAGSCGAVRASEAAAANSEGGAADSIDRQSVIDFELAVELEDKAVLETLPAAFPLDPRLQAHTKHDRPGIAYRHALTDFLADPS